ncbi:MAG: IclR family transcriptional regulator [Anaerolineae bacterium]|nr:IclR family transcriptional regulator [Anaerolineae bacterium]
MATERELNDGGGNDGNLSGTVIKALDVLACLGKHARPMSTQEIAKACAMSRPTTYRLLATLMSRGFVRTDGNYNYSLGTELISLGKVVLDSINLPDLARPHLHELCTLSNETANLSILEGTEILYIGKEESLQTIQSPVFMQLRSSIGTRLPLHCSAMGKAILAQLNIADCQALIREMTPLKAYAINTITEVDALQEELGRIREQGYAIDDREIDDGTRCVAAPIFDSSKRVIGAMSVAGPAYRLPLDHLHHLSTAVVRATQTLSRQLGYVAPIKLPPPTG